jgi:hypothetical protein
MSRHPCFTCLVHSIYVAMFKTNVFPYKLTVDYASWEVSLCGTFHVLMSYNIFQEKSDLFALKISSVNTSANFNF